MDTGQVLLQMMPPAANRRSHGPDFSGLGCEQRQEAAMAKESVRLIESCENLISKSPKLLKKRKTGCFLLYFHRRILIQTHCDCERKEESVCWGLFSAAD